jgi:hypothetical protein
MTVKEQVLTEAPDWTEEQAARALRAVAHAAIDEWGDLDAFSADASGVMLRRLDEQEAAAGSSWEDDAGREARRGLVARAARQQT